MRLLLLGCTGFIGRELVPRLLDAGHQLTIISRKEPHKLHQKCQSKQLLYLKLDPSNPENWKEEKLINAITQANGVINLAGEPIADKRWTPKHCTKIQSSRLITTRCLINTISKLKRPPEFLVNGSAIGYYGTSQNSLFTEDCSSGNDFLSNLCNEWEDIATERPKSTRLLLLRIGIVLEADGGALGKMLPVFRSGFGGPLGNGKQWMSWIHRTDLCKIITQAVSNTDFKGVINAVAPNPSTMADFSDKLGKTLGRPSLLPVPGALLQLLLGDGAKVVLEGQNVSSAGLTKKKFAFEYPYLEQALEAITEKNRNVQYLSN